jgi:MFS family permease
MLTRRRGYRELLVLFSLLAFASSLTGSFWVVFLYDVHGLPPAAVAALIGGATFVAATASIGMGRLPSVPATPTMIAGLACLAGTLVALASLRGPALYAAFTLLFGAYIPLFFIPWNTLVAEETQPRDRGAKLAGITLTFSLATVGAPFLGGVIASGWGFPALFLVGAAVLAAAGVLAAWIAEPEERVRLRWNPRRFGRATTCSFVAQGGIDGILWTAIPLVTFSFVQGKVELGALFSLFALTGGVIAVVLGRWSDRIRHRLPFVALGVGLSIPLAIGVGLAPSLAAFTVANGALSATLAIAPTFVISAVVDRLEGEIGSVMQTREVILNLSRGAASAAILALFLLGMPVNLAVLLVAGLLPFMALAERFR